MSLLDVLNEMKQDGFDPTEINSDMCRRTSAAIYNNITKLQIRQLRSPGTLLSDCKLRLLCP